MKVYYVLCDVKTEFLFGRKIICNLQYTNMKKVCIL